MCRGPQHPLSQHPQCLLWDGLQQRTSCSVLLPAPDPAFQQNASKPTF